MFRNFFSNSIKFSYENSDIRIVIKKFEKEDDFDLDDDDKLKMMDQEFNEPNNDFCSIQKSELRSIGKVSIAVIDSGVGISSENLVKVFGEFNQFDPHKLQGGGGTGLGNILSSYYQHTQCLLLQYSVLTVNIPTLYIIH